MASITITFRDGTVQRFPHEGRPGGSYTKSIRYEGAFVIVKDEWDKETAFPSELIHHIEKREDRF